MFKPAELVWAEYRREDLGFRIEMPGKPQIAVGNDPALKETIVELSYDVVTFSVTVLEFQKALTPQEAEQELEARAAMARTAMDAARSRSFTMDGIPVRESVAEMDGYKAVYRNAVVGNRAILLNVAWHPTVDTNAAAERSLQSFALLPDPR